MKPKEIVISVICFVVIVGSIYTFLKMQKSSQTEPVQTPQANTVEFNGDLTKYDEVMQKVEGYTDYGTPTLDNLGRTNPFAPVQ